MTRKSLIVSLAIVFIIGFAMVPQAAQLLYEGTLNDAEGRPLADGAHFFDLRIFSSETEGAPVWAEAHDGVMIANGAYSIVLGEKTMLDLPPGVYWLDVTVDGEVIKPRTKVMITLNDCTITGNLIIEGMIGVGTANPQALIEVNGGNSEAGIRLAWGSSYPFLYGEMKKGTSSGLVINSRANGSWADMHLQTEDVTRIFIDSGGSIGMGTQSPSGMLHIHNQSAGGTLLKVHGGDFVTDDALIVLGSGRVGIARDGSPTHLLDVGNSGAYCDGGAWVNGSSRAYKENISELTESQALEVLTGLEPTSFTYKSDDEEVYLGFIAEDVPDLVATKDRKGLVAMDIVAVLTKVVQTQQKQINDLQEALDGMQR